MTQVTLATLLQGIAHFCDLDYADYQRDWAHRDDVLGNSWTQQQVMQMQMLAPLIETRQIDLSQGMYQ